MENILNFVLLLLCTSVGLLEYEHLYVFANESSAVKSRHRLVLQFNLYIEIKLNNVPCYFTVSSFNALNTISVTRSVEDFCNSSTYICIVIVCIFFVSYVQLLSTSSAQFIDCMSGN